MSAPASSPALRPLRIAYIGARGVVGTYSGIETYYEEVGSRLAERGHEVTAYCRKYFTPPMESYRGVRVRRLPCWQGKHLETISHSLLATLEVLLKRFDIVQYHAIGSAPLAAVPRLFGSKTVVSVRGLDWQRAKWGAVARGYLQMGEWASARCPTATCVVSAGLQDHYEKQHGRRPFMIPNAVVPPERVPLERLEEHGLRGGDFFLFAGRISPEKGVHTLLEALRPVAGGKKLVIAGGSSFTDDYIDRVRALAWDDVLFLGRVDRDFMHELLTHCHAYVLPSVMEGLSVGLLEALSYGLCIVTTSIPENLEVVGDCALTFPAGDVEALREQLRRAVEEPETVEKMRRRTAQRAAGWPAWDGVAALTEALYYRLLGLTVADSDDPTRLHAGAL
ncbi:MAG: glycosyltransferase family 4 protein [Acidobacteriota bacterium]